MTVGASTFGALRVVILGGGIGGLLNALVLARGGHDVTVLERDPEPPPDSDEDAWQNWSRGGVAHFHQPHALLGRGRQVVEQELPEVARQLAAIAPHIPLSIGAPDPSSLTTDDARFDAYGIRRSTLERLLAGAADEDPRIEVRRGVTVGGLVTSEGAGSRGVHVRGVQSESGERFIGDLVVDASGRRTPVGGWLRNLGHRAESSQEIGGLTYFTRWFGHDSELPPVETGTFAGSSPGLVALVYPTDGQTCAVSFVAPTRDRLIEQLLDPAAFMRVAGGFPLLAPWIDPAVASPISDVISIGSIQSHHLRLRSDGESVVTGLVNTGDSGVSTDPRLGRGLPLAADLAVRLRYLLSTTDDPVEVAQGWDDVHVRHHRPWYGDSLEADATLSVEIAERPPASVPNPDRVALQRAAAVDMDCWRPWTEVNHVFATPDERWWSDEDLLMRARLIAREHRPAQPDMSAAVLESLITG